MTWRETDGYKRFKDAFRKFPEREREKIEIIIEETKGDYFSVVFCNIIFKNLKLLR